MYIPIYYCLFIKVGIGSINPEFNVNWMKDFKLT